MSTESLGWPYHRTEADVRRRLPKASRGDPIPRLGALIVRTLMVLIWNGVIVWGVLARDWDAITVVLLFLAEAWIALATDVPRVALPWTRARIHQDEEDETPDFPWVALSFEFIFIAFFSVFCLLGLTPGTDLVDTAMNAREAVISRLGELRWTLPLILIFQLEMLLRDILARPAPGQGKAVHLRAGGWMFLIFFSVMTFPLGELVGFSPVGIALVMVGLKTFGQLFGVWAVPIVVHLPEAESEKR